VKHLQHESHPAFVNNYSQKEVHILLLRRVIMRNKHFLLLGVIVLLSVFALWGCPKKAEVTTAPATPQETAPVAEPEKMPSDEGARKPSPDESMESAAAREAAAAAAAGMHPIYFDFDQSAIRNDAKEVLKANAEWLKAHPKAKVRIEGNCDERGTKEYNQALGQRRAASAKKYLVDLGISAKRISLVSYGKEKSICSESSEGCWQKNRRDDLVAVAE
jgi:peptidoglycan-associated lipoprotein